MTRHRLLWMALAAMAAGSMACTHTSRIALISDGDLAGRTLEGAKGEKTLKGEDCLTVHYLSKAFRNALQGTDYDTLINVDVTTTTGLFIFSNCVQVQGEALRSKDLPMTADIEVTP